MPSKRSKPNVIIPKIQPRSNQKVDVTQRACCDHVGNRAPNEPGDPATNVVKGFKVDQRLNLESLLEIGKITGSKIAKLLTYKMRQARLLVQSKG
jgi:hypothetical protein